MNSLPASTVAAVLPTPSHSVLPTPSPSEPGGYLDPETGQWLPEPTPPKYVITRICSSVNTVLIYDEGTEPGYHIKMLTILGPWLTNSALVYEPIYAGGGGVAGSQPMGTAVHMELK